MTSKRTSNGAVKQEGGVPSVRDLVDAASRQLEAAGIEATEAARDAEVLARHVLGWDRARLFAHGRDPAPLEFTDRFAEAISRRARREPVSQILGHREFWGREFDLAPGVLTPRPETEWLVEEALACAAACRTETPVILDACTGCGCVAISLACALPHARVIATDLCWQALALARRNAARHGVADRVALIRTSLAAGLRGPLDLAVANPPYVPTPDLDTLPPEVRNYESRLALDGGSDGLQTIRALIGEAARVVRPEGWLLFEFGAGQHVQIPALLGGTCWHLVRIQRDLQGHPRTAVCRRLG